MLLATIGGLVLGTGAASAATPAHAAVDGRGDLGGSGGIPTVLTPKDAERYRAIFAHQEAGRFAQADRDIALLGDRVLMGHVLAQRYLHPAYKSTYKELSEWLAKHADQPEAKRLYKMALARKPKADKAPRAPVGNDSVGTGHGDPITPEKSYSAAKRRGPEEAARFAALQRPLEAAVKAGKPEAAEAVLHRPEFTRHLDRAEQDELRARVAHAYFLKGNPKRAFDLAAQASRSRAEVPLADWTAGLAAWRLKDPNRAAYHFGELARSRGANAWNASAAAFWASRAHLVAHRPQRVAEFLQLAAENPRTFYGMLAMRQLGMELPFDWREPPLTASDVASLRLHGGAIRAFALIEIERLDEAKGEVALLVAREGIALGPALVGLASRLNMAGVQLMLSRRVLDRSSPYYLSSIYPVPHWEPEAGFAIDKAFVFAVMRHESGFNTRAQSRVGASGLMQLMPRTASLMAEDNSLRRDNKHKLLAPEFNIELGQRYIQSLMAEPAVGDNLFMVIAAYNAGPGNVKAWSKLLPVDDPLLALESIPIRETRLFVQRVATTY
ncbi:MAG: lytic transglycosylase domain-containing protein, partial [Alphaproteobacteria bacterium]|nr:lytic transglycosylase domain-containing protein [Alphaproteobacteria bacterium]